MQVGASIAGSMDSSVKIPPPLGLRDAALEHVCKNFGGAAGANADDMYNSFCDALADGLGYEIEMSNMQGFSDAAEFKRAHWDAMDFADTGSNTSGRRMRHAWLKTWQASRPPKQGTGYQLDAALKRRPRPLVLWPAEIAFGETEDVPIREFMHFSNGRCVRINRGVIERRPCWGVFNNCPDEIARRRRFRETVLCFVRDIGFGCGASESSIAYSQAHGDADFVRGE